MVIEEGASVDAVFERVYVHAEEIVHAGYGASGVEVVVAVGRECAASSYGYEAGGNGVAGGCGFDVSD